MTCAGPLSTTNFVSSLFFCNFAGFASLSHNFKFGVVLVLNVENSR